MGKTYVVTGGNAAAAFQATRILLSKHAKVVIQNRNADKSTAAIADQKEYFGAQANVCFVPMALSNLESVRAATDEVLKNSFTDRCADLQPGHFGLRGVLFDRIETSKGRIVAVASLGFNMGVKTIQFDDVSWDKNFSANPVYGQSKVAQMKFAYQLQDRLTGTGKDLSAKAA